MIRDVRYKSAILVGFGVVIGATFFFVSPIAQDAQYHNFADRRTIFGISNFWDVVSNLPFAVCGLMGLAFLFREAGQAFKSPSERWPYVFFFAALILTFAGSSFYHLNPNNETLVRDRIPMSIGFMAILAAVIAERVDVRTGTRLLIPLVALGIVSVLFWHFTESRGAGDLRFYAVVQFFPMLAIPFMVLFFSSRYTEGKYLLILAGFYGAAKVFEYFDHAVFSAGHLWSGHTLKHFTSAAGTFWVLAMLRCRTRVREQVRTEPATLSATT